VVWVTPSGAQGNRTAGVGVQFADSHEGEVVRSRIETLLAGMLNADKATQTM
jgi:type IV pilus assembly protein PilZ